MADDLHHRIHAAQVSAGEQAVIEHGIRTGLIKPAPREIPAPTQSQIDAGADALRQRQMAGRITRPWTDLPNSDKRKWREHAEAVLCAAAQASE